MPTPGDGSVSALGPAASLQAITPRTRVRATGLLYRMGSHGLVGGPLEPARPAPLGQIIAAPALPSRVRLAGSANCALHRQSGSRRVTLPKRGCPHFLGAAGQHV